MIYTLYTTTSSKWYREQAIIAAEYLNKTEGRDLKIKMVHVKPPRGIQTIVDSDGDIRFSWDWFTAHFPNEKDGVGFHFTPYYKKKWRLAKRINGTKNTRNKDYPEFWMCTGKEDVEGYEFSNFVRILIHEISHFDEDLDDRNGNRLVQESVHIMDYKMKKIHLYPLLVDYRGYLLKRKINKLTNQVVDFIRNSLKL
jgi:hypothetical protein